MSQQTFVEPIDAAIAEYLATFESYWKPKTSAKYRAELRDLCTWLATEGRPLTTASLDYTTLLAYVGHLKQMPVARSAFRGDAAALASATTTTPRSLNTVNATMRAVQGFVRWLIEDGRLSADPYGKKYRRGRTHPLLPRAVTPPRGRPWRNSKRLSVAALVALRSTCVTRPSWRSS